MLAQREQNLIRNLGLSQEQITQITARTGGGRYDFANQQQAFQQAQMDRLTAASQVLGKSMEELTRVMEMTAEQWEEAQRQIRQTLEASATDIESNMREFAQSLPEALGITRLEEYQRSLAVSETLAPEMRLAAARSQYEETLGRALGGDVEAARAFPELAQQLLGIGRETYASGTEFQELFRQVNVSLNQVLDRQREQQADLMSGLQITMVELRVAWIEELRATKNALVKSLDDVKRELQKLEAA
jgi:hypothetical protein